jgi:signal transduction histidine kinase/CheY-like chemotaxis protein
MIKRLGPSVPVHSTAPSDLGFAAQLAELLRPLASPEEIKARASRLLGEHLAADRVAYFEVTGDHFVVEFEYTRGVPELAARYSVASFGPTLIGSLRAGQTIVDSDVWQNPAVASADRQTFDALHIRAHVGVPLLKNGALVGGFAVNHSQPRAWTSDDVALIGETAERTWAAVEHARSTRQVEKSERLRRMALDAAELGVWSVNPADMSITTDERFRTIFHGSPDFSSYERDFGAIHPEDQPRVAAAVAAAVRPDDPAPYVQEYRVVRPDGSVRWVSATGRAYLVDGLTGRRVESFDGTVRDITEHKQAQERMRLGDERVRAVSRLLQLMADGSGDAIATLDCDFRFTFTNESYRQNFRSAFGVEAVIGDRLHEALAHLPDDQRHAIELWGRALNGERITLDAEFGDATRDRRWWSFRFYPIHDEQGQVVGAAHNAADISVRMNAAADRERFLAELQEQDRRKDEFLAMLSHELRNPLAPISNAVQLLRLQGAEAPRQQQARAVIERQVGQLRRLVDDLLEVSRITTGRIQLRLECISVAGLVDRAVETTRPLVERRRHTVAVEMPDEPIMLRADASRLEQVLVNLLTNSAKFSSEGASILVTAAQEGDEAVLRVRDTGDGIAPELLPRVFDLFTQAERSLARSEGGLGIGLSLVKRLVELHGGRVEVTSTLGQGSEFVVRMPSAIAQEHSQAPSQATPVEASASVSVLVVDDNVDSAETLAEFLRMSGHEARTAHDGPAAVTAANEWQPDMVLLDIGLPQMDGYQVAALMRQTTQLQKMVIVALTGYGQEADHVKTAKAGFDHHLVKPADLQRVLEIVSSARR